ncbi:hypothetical protein HN51_066886 [Arachis hypogaea]|nr:uncharacterized protein DS421_14g471060 [Arachis hypogaea]
MHSPHLSNVLFVKHSLHPSNVTLCSHETGAARVGVSTGAVVIGVTTGAAKPSPKAGHGGLRRCWNTLSLGCIANNANNCLPDFWSTYQKNLIRLARRPRFQLGSRAHPRLLQQQPCPFIHAGAVALIRDLLMIGFFADIDYAF